MQNHVVRHVLLSLLLVFGACTTVLAESSLEHTASEEVEVSADTLEGGIGVTDPTNPFRVTDEGYPIPLVIAGAVITPGLSVSIPVEGTSDYTFHPRQSFYRHEAGEFTQIETSFFGPAAVLVPGTYTAVYQTFSLCLTQHQPTAVQSWWSQLRERIIPTAHAFFCIEDDRTYAVTFTLIAEPPPPTGASSVLFLPGIQASRLYTEGIFGTENRIWEPNINADVEKLAMTSDGVSVNTVYTRDVLDEIFGISNIYKDFLGELADLKTNEIIADFTPFAYDWRYDVRDIVRNGVQYPNEVRYLVTVVEALAEASYTEKVTIIAHSNGGLLAKALMMELEQRDVSHLVDKIVFVGTPQLGTPKAVGSLLHGLDLNAVLGIVMNQRTGREVLQHLPAAYGLLPSVEYLTKVNDAIIAGEPFGRKEVAEDLVAFYTSGGNGRGESMSLNVPSILNPQLLQKAATLHQELSAWRAPEGTEVFEIAGTGIQTIKGFEYRVFPCSPSSLIPCETGSVYKPYPLFTTFGDETVVATSALAYTGDKFYAEVDLAEEGLQLFIKQREHQNLTESPTVQSFIDSIIKFRYFNDTLEIPDSNIVVGNRYTVIGIHSPVDIWVENSQGNKIGQSKNTQYNEIINASYFELGGSKYVVLPKAGTYTVQLEGYATGTYSVTIDSLEGDSQQTIGAIMGASSTPVMTGVMQINNGILSPLQIDNDGDGTDDVTGDFETGMLTNKSITPIFPITTQQEKQVSGTLIRPQLVGQVAGVSMTLTDEQLYLQTVAELLRLVQQYLNLLHNF